MERSSTGATLTDIATAIGITKSSAHALLNALAGTELAERNPLTARWSLGFRTLELGMAYYRTNPSFDNVSLAAARIKAACKESVYYAVLRGTEVLVFNVFLERSHALTIEMMPGDRVPAHCTALGKALLSGLSDQEILSLYGGAGDRALQRRTERGPRTVDELLKEVAACRESGYAFNNEENEYGVCAIAAPVRDDGQRVAAAIGIAVPATRMDLERRAQLGALIKREALSLAGVRGLPPPWRQEG
jgi:DNA-binding IclR family transcriptional regulator